MWVTVLNSFFSSGSNPISVHCTWHVRLCPLGTKAWGASAIVSTTLLWEGTKVSASPQILFTLFFVLTYFLPSIPHCLPYALFLFFFSQGTFIVTFDASYMATLGDKLLLRANASRWAQARYDVSLILLSPILARDFSPGFLPTRAPHLSPVRIICLQ